MKDGAEGSQRLPVPLQSRGTTTSGSHMFTPDATCVPPPFLPPSLLWDLGFSFKL